MTLDALLEKCPPIWPDNLQPFTREKALESGRTIIVLDDDPTGTQTVYDVPVITTWTTDHLRNAFAENLPLLYILTNTRSVSAAEAKRINEEVARALLAARESTGRDFCVISRSDSTLRGYFPLETDVLGAMLGMESSPVLVAPFFEEGGRVTIDDVHYVVENGEATPAAETPFAQDAVFGFKNSNLPAWVEEKTAGRVKAAEVQSISLDSIRKGGPEVVAEELSKLPDGSVCVVNAVEMRDMEVVAAAVYGAWARGRTFLFRSAASIVRALGGLEKRALLERGEMVLQHGHGGLIAVGSHVPKSTLQLERLCAAEDVTMIQMSVKEILSGEFDGSSIVRKIDDHLECGRNVVLFTSREVELWDDDAANLEISQKVSAAMVETIATVSQTPQFLIAKGGITSSDIASKALGVAQATVIGQILPGVPVWRLGAETRFPGLGYVVFPGNVGDENALVTAVRRLKS